MAAETDRPVRWARWRSGRGLALAVALALILAGCYQWWSTYRGSSDSTMASVVLTPESGDAYDIQTISGTVVDAIAHDDNTGGNLREVFWPTNAPAVQNAESCATWASQTRAVNQQGAVLRQRQRADGSTQALTVTKNIFYGAEWVLNFHTWDTARDGIPFVPIGSVDLKPVLYGEPLPWHVCARAVGDQMTVKVWTGQDAEPAWGDRRHGGSVTVPSGWVYPGRAGWYIGHLEPGDSVRFADLATARHGTEQ